MNPKSKFLIFFLIVGLLFIGIGDIFLPQPLSNISSKTRSSVNGFLMGLFPDKKPINPYEQTDKLLQEVREQRD